MVVVNNFLPIYYFNKLCNLFEYGDTVKNTTLNWNWNSNSVYEDKPDNCFMFTHSLWSKETPGRTTSFFEKFEPILYSLNDHQKFNNLIRMKLNLYTNQGKRIVHTAHTDINKNPFLNKGNNGPEENITICILNFTTCNGGTIIDNVEYPSIANQALIFNNKIIHQGITQTDKSNRICLNIAVKNKNKE